MTAPATSRAAPWHIEVGFVTHPGLVRERNEDAYTLFVPYEGEEHLSPIDGVFAVADGMGGHDAGDVASGLVVDAVMAAFAPGQAGHDSRESIHDTITRTIGRVHRDLQERATAARAERGMGSTLALAIVDGSTLHVTHVGDSRVYRLRDGALARLTDDHTWVAEQIRAGVLTPEEADSHSRRNVLTQCLGIGNTPRVTVRMETLLHGDRFLLCSDGLHGQVSDDVLARVLLEETPQGAASRLAAMANERGGPDNVTVVVFQVRRARPLARTLPDGLLVVTDGAGVMVRRRPRALAHGLLVAGLTLLVAVGAAWFYWARPASVAGYTPPAARPAAPVEDSLRARLPAGPDPVAPDSARPPSPSQATPASPTPPTPRIDHHG